MDIQTTQSFKVDSATLWRAITEHKQMIQWFFDNIPDFQPKVGFETSFTVHAGNRPFLHHWKIKEVVDRKKIVYEWNYPDYSGNGEVTFRIDKAQNGSHLTVTAVGMDSFPQDIEEFQRESCQNGWNYFIKDRLTSFLSNK